MEKDINYIISKVLGNEASADEVLLFSEWLLESESNRNEFNMLKSYWNAEVSSNEKASPEMSFMNAEERMSRNNKKKKFIYVMSMAGIITLLIGIGFLISLYPSANANQGTFMVTTDKGQRSSVSLPDGTKVWLNSYTDLSYTNNYGQGKRVVTLNGEAYFDVASMENCNFIVQAGGMEIEALGTSFNVKAYAGDAKITTTLLTGKVRVSVGKATTTLEANQYASYIKDDQKLLAGTLDEPEFATMWRNNALASDGQTLGEIAVTLNRMYNVHIVFETEKIRNERFRGTILNRSLDNVIELISLTTPIIYTSIGDTIYISEKPMK
ncbi:FecR family protein [Bacteroides sp. 519]|uniref:FecR family protein n=1 Tax=Bacteroides sp. 519 TaxID=2302937 RepID=UPI0013D130EA|nr:FecR family protein [Bacteroides sp. 519]NDV57520.1 DUF4974 domain-containing protein [Bacteroides sp. 519]